MPEIVQFKTLDGKILTADWTLFEESEILTEIIKSQINEHYIQAESLASYSKKTNLPNCNSNSSRRRAVIKLSKLEGPIFAKIIKWCKQHRHDRKRLPMDQLKQQDEEFAENSRSSSPASSNSVSGGAASSLVHSNTTQKTPVYPIDFTNTKLLNSSCFSRQYLNQYISSCVSEHPVGMNREDCDSMIMGKRANGMNDDLDIKPWDKEFLSSMDQDMLFKFIMAANYINHKAMLDVACRFVALMIKTESQDQRISEKSRREVEKDLEDPEDMRRRIMQRILMETSSKNATSHKS